MKKVNASLFIEVLCNCPHCGAIDDIFDLDRTKDVLGQDYRAENCDLEITCSECSETYIVENIHF